MQGSPDPQHGGQPLVDELELSSASAALDRLCDQFEKRWNAGERPDIASYLTDSHVIPLADRFRRLLRIEITLRRDAGEQPQRDEYRGKFPNFCAEVSEVFQEPLLQNTSKSTFAATVAWHQSSSEVGRPASESLGQQEPERIGRYKVCKLLGVGGFGKVYQAYDEQLDRYVALKVPNEACFASDQSKRAFFDEARTAAKLKHSGLVGVYDIEVEGDSPCIVQEWIDGPNLKDWATNASPSRLEIVRLLTEVAEAVGFAHQRGFLHRDIKPTNILIDSAGHARLADFGLAVHESAQQQLAGDISGTLAYMSPEQLRGETHLLDGRSDIWSLGVMLYELLLRRRPFSGKTGSDLRIEIQSKEARPLRQMDPSIDKELERICLKCLAKRPTDRYGSAADLVEDLRQWQQHQARVGSGAPPESPGGYGTKLRRVLSSLSIGPLGCQLVIALCLLAMFVPAILGPLGVATKIPPNSPAGPPQQGTPWLVNWLKQHGADAVFIASSGAEVPLTEVANVDGDAKVVSINLEGCDVHDDELSHLVVAAPSLRELSLAKTSLGDAGLKHLAALSNLVQLDVSHTQITDQGLDSLSQIAALQELNLQGTAITSNGLAQLATLRQLERLNIAYTKVGDVGLESLALRNLKSIDIEGTAVTNRGFEQLLAASPQLTSSPPAAGSQIPGPPPPQSPQPQPPGLAQDQVHQPLQQLAAGAADSVVESHFVSPAYSAPTVEVNGTDTIRGAVMFVFDCSASMKGQTLQTAQLQLNAVLERLWGGAGPSLKVGLMVYGTRTDVAKREYARTSRRESPVLSPAGQAALQRNPSFSTNCPHPDGDVETLVPLLSGDALQARVKLNTINDAKCLGFTPLYHAATKAIEAIHREAGDQHAKRVVIVSDGVNMPYDTDYFNNPLRYQMGPTGVSVDQVDYQALESALTQARDVKVTLQIFGIQTNIYDRLQLQQLKRLQQNHPNFELREVQSQQIADDILQSFPKTRVELTPTAGSSSSQLLTLNSQATVRDWDSPSVLRKDYVPRMVRLTLPGEERWLEQPLQLLGGERIQMSYDAADASLSFDDDGSRQRDSKPLVSPATGKYRKLLLDSLEPEFAGSSVRKLRFRLRPQDQAQNFVPRPKYVWLEISPRSAGGKAVRKTFPCLDASWLDAVNLPRFEAAVQNWPDAPRANVQAYFLIDDQLPVLEKANVSPSSQSQTVTIGRETWRIANRLNAADTSRTIEVVWEPSERGAIDKLLERAVWLTPAPQETQRRYLLDGSKVVHQFTYTNPDLMRRDIEVQVVSKAEFQRTAYSTLNFEISVAK